MLDANQNVVSKAALFREAWKAYPNIDYRASNKVIAVDPGARTVRTEFDTVKYDVLNLIPPQRAGAIAVQADLVGADKRWCEVDQVTYESVKQKGVHVIGDATTGLAGAQVGQRRQRHGQDLRERGGRSSSTASRCSRSPPGNTCYSWVSDREAIAVVNCVQDRERQGGPDRAEAHARAERRAWPSARLGWAQSIWNDVLG